MSVSVVLHTAKEVVAFVNHGSLNTHVLVLRVSGLREVNYVAGVRMLTLGVCGYIALTFFFPKHTQH